MITAVDSSVLLAIGKGESGSEAWANFLHMQAEFGRLVACEVVVAETSAFFDNPDDILLFLRDLNVEFDSIQSKAAILAGSLFRTYRRTGGPREYLIPDFLIGAHAQQQCNQLAATDKGYLRRYFPKLKVVGPKEAP